VWWRPGRALDAPYQPLEPSDVADLEESAGRR
jgi:hypothetical protein